jgi:cytochrome c-type biogenesis protein
MSRAAAPASGTGRALAARGGGGARRPAAPTFSPSFRHRAARRGAAPAAGLALYELVAAADGAVAAQLAGVGPAAFAAVFGAGLLTSLSPCALSALPLALGYIGGFDPADNDAPTAPEFEACETCAGGLRPARAAPPAAGAAARAAAFAAGLASTLAAAGAASAAAGAAYGTVLGAAAPLAASAGALGAGLHLLGALPALEVPSELRLPSLDLDVGALRLPPAAQAYAAGAASALAASPCATPVLATLLAYSATSGDRATGAALLFAYALGYVAPLGAAAAGAGAARRALAARAAAGWVPAASGALLVCGGTFGLLSRLVPS